MHADTPRRIQCSRATGYRSPPRTKRVCRPSRWGNRWKAENQPGIGWVCLDSRDKLIIPARDLAHAHELAVEHYATWAAPHADQVRAELRGWNLACFCAPHLKWHADVLLRIANAPLACEAAAP